MAIFSISAFDRFHPAFSEDADVADAFDIESFVESELATPAFSEDADVADAFDIESLVRSELAAPSFSEDADVADAVGHICILT
jgi:hypothetical protein